MSGANTTLIWPGGGLVLPTGVYEGFLVSKNLTLFVWRAEFPYPIRSSMQDFSLALFTDQVRFDLFKSESSFDGVVW